MIFTFKNSTDWMSLIKVASIDDEYLNAVEQKDNIKLSNMINQAAQKSGYTTGPVLHGSPVNDITVFKIFGGRSNKWGDGFYFTDEEMSSTSKIYSQGGSVYSVYLSGNFLEFEGDTPINLPEVIKEKMILDYGHYLGEELVNNFGSGEYIDSSDYSKIQKFIKLVVKSLGYNGLAVSDHEFPGEIHYIVYESSQIKSTDVTRDNSGNIIPLSQRFNSSNSDIRY